MQTQEHVGFTAAAGVKWLFAAAAAIWLQIPLAAQTLVIFMAFDFGTGLLVAITSKTLDSRKAAVGLRNKILTLVLVASAHRISEFLHLGFDLGSAAATAYIIHEVISIMENCSAAGVDIPEVLLDTLSRAKGMGRDQREIKALKLRQSQETDALDLKQRGDKGAGL